MTLSPETSLESNPVAESYAASINPAVARCCQAWARAHDAAAANGKSYPDHEARKAYRRALPPLSGPDNIRDFIACTAHAILIGAIESNDGARLLYAAQVARGALPAQPAAKKPPETA
jgi:hypothetical protein